MSTVTLDRSFVVKITFALKESPYTTTNRYFCSQNFIDDAYDAQPLGVRLSGTLMGISGLSLSAANYFPDPRRGNVVIANVRGSAGYNKKFTDYLERETIIEQPITIYAFEKPVGAEAPAIFSEVEFTGLIKSVTQQGLGVNLQVEARTMERAEVARQITAALFPTAPTRSIGRWVPMCIGSAQVPAYPVDEGSTDIDWVYAMHGKTPIYTYPVGGVSNYYSKDADGDWAEMVNPASSSTAVFQKESGSGAAAATSANIATYTADSEMWCFKLSHSSSTASIITNGYIYFYDNGGATTPNGQFNFYIIQGDSNGYPNKIIARGQREKSDFSWNNNNSQDQIPFYFEKPVFLHPDKTYFLGSSQHGTTTEQTPVEYTSSPSSEYWVKKNDSWRLVFISTEGQPSDCRYGLYGISFTDTTSDSDRKMAYITGTQQSLSNITAPDIDGVPLVLQVDGLLDNLSGTITGGASDPLVHTQHLAKYLMGATLDDPHGAVTALEDNYPRSLNGASSGRAFNTEFLTDACKQTNCKVYYMRDGTPAIWAYGCYQLEEDIAYISEADADLLDWSISDSRSVINRVQLQYQEKAIPVDLELFLRELGQPRLVYYHDTLPPILGGINPFYYYKTLDDLLKKVTIRDVTVTRYNVENAEKLNKNFGKNLDWYNGSDLANAAQIDLWTNASVELYGEKLLGTGYNQCDLISDDASAEFLAMSYLVQNAQPAIYARIRLPYWKKNFRAIELMDLIDLEHNDAPSYFGTSFDGLGKFPVYSGTEHTSITLGHPWREAKSYRCRVIGRTTNFNIGGEAALDLTLKIIDNPNEIL